MARTEHPTQTLKYRKLEIATKPLVNLLVGHLLAKTDIINDATTVNFSPGFERIFRNHVSMGRKPLLVANHSSHFDIESLIRLLQEIETATGVSINGWYIGVARSMFTGHQGPIVKSVQEHYKERVKIARVEMVPVTRLKDETNYGILTSNKEWIRARRNSRTNDYGLILLPEGSVQSGKSANPFWPFSERRRGMQIPSDDALDQTIEYYSSNEIDMFFITAGIAGGYGVFTSSWKVPSLQAVLALYGRHSPRFIDIRATIPGSLAQIKRQLGPSGSITDLIMRSVASQLPDDPRNLRGIHTQILRTPGYSGDLKRSSL